ncbi:MAG: phenylalanine--tRNA ligase subunit beta [Candidatus Bathyarchaeota archaeon]|nr:phenylalanine--tRNA ligase subunit beta [Candidatus Bathyarchaeota archaeon]
MPTIDIDLADFEKLLGINYHGNMEKLDEDLAYVKSEVKASNEKEGTVSIEFKDTNRPDLWGAEGLSRGLRCYLGLEKGPRQYSIGESVLDVFVDAQLKTIRPFIGCSVVKNVQLTDTIIRGLMQMQDKLDRTFGRSRQKTSIGMYCLDLLTPPLSYNVARPDAFSFVPLGFSEEMTLAGILEQHPKGQEYGHIVKKHSNYPILLDAEQKVLSFPPIINSNDLGKVTEEAHNVLVEVTGTLQQTVLNTLNLVTTALIDRGGKVYSANINYPEDPAYPNQKVVTPNFQNKHLTLNVEYTNKLTGLQLTSERSAKLLPIAGLGVGEVTQETVDVLVPCYRIDVMHQADLVEDVAVAYGYNNIEPLWRDLPTTGAPRPEQQLINIARELMVGAGYQEALNYTLTNPESLFTKMNRQPTPTVDLFNPKLVTMTCLRNWLLPGLLEFLSVNQSVEFPQKIFELGKITLSDESCETKTRDEEWVAAVTTHANAGFSEIKACLDAFFRNFGVNWQIKPTSHPSFIEGRTGAIITDTIEVGVVGEVHPLVLEAWKLENPTAAFEVNLQQVIELKKNHN